MAILFHFQPLCRMRSASLVIIKIIAALKPTSATVNQHLCDSEETNGT